MPKLNRETSAGPLMADQIAIRADSANPAAAKTI
jgi:hypothetical protein